MCFLWLLIPIFIVTAILIYFFDGRPIFFKQRRVGLDGCDFYLIKFRTMKNNSKNIFSSFDVGSNLRVTKLGKILRKSKIDELPQLINIINAEMTLVGPRPEVRSWVEKYPNRWSKVHKVRPGITDNASIKFRNEELLLAESPDPEMKYMYDILPQKLTLYEEYVENQSFTTDIKILIRTFLAILFR